jgi:hypothetical protein
MSPNSKAPGPLPGKNSPNTMLIPSRLLKNAPGEDTGPTTIPNSQQSCRPRALTRHSKGFSTACYVTGKDGELLSPYASLPPLEINGTPVSVAEGTGAIRAYEAMVYGLERNEPGTREKWKRLLLQYCKLDSLSMYMVWEHWRGVVKPE